MCVVPRDRQDDAAGSRIARNLQSFKSLDAPVRRAIHRTRQWLLGQQQADGSWCAELEGDTILESETILLLAFLGHEDSELARRCAAYLVEKQLPDGGWAMYPGGAAEISGSVKAYFALKLTGHDPSAEYMQRARAAILAHGGADAVNSFTRFYLALLGQISYEQCPAVPPEIVLLPKWFPVNLYAVSSWSRTIIVPLSIISALRPVRRLEPRLGIRELFLREPENWPPLRCPGLPGGTGLFSWDRFFRTIDRLLQVVPAPSAAAAAAQGPGRRRAVDARPLRPERRPGRDLSADGLEHRGAEMPGLSRRQPRGAVLPRAIAGTWYWTTSRRARPGSSPASRPSGTRRLRSGRLAAKRRAARQSRPSARRSHWLLARQITPPRRLGRNGRRRAGRMVLRVRQRLLSRLRRHGDGADGAADAVFRRRGGPRGPAARTASGRRDRRGGRTKPGSRSPRWRRRVSAIDRGLRWLLAMQNRDGGWGAFDRNNDREFLCHVPFADHNAMIDPSTPDLTGRVLEALGQLGPPPGRSGRGSGRGLRPPHPERRRQLVRPLGRQLHLRHLAGAHRAGRPSACRPTIRPSWPGPTGCWPTSRPAAAGANRPTATSSRTSAAKARPPPRKRPGR